MYQLRLYAENEWFSTVTIWGTYGSDYNIVRQVEREIKSNGAVLLLLVTMIPRAGTFASRLKSGLILLTISSDSTNRAIKTLQRLLISDFPEVPLVISNEGVITKINRR